MTNDTLVVALASLGGVLWLMATVRERFPTATGGTIRTIVRNLLPLKETGTVTPLETPGSEPTGSAITINDLERELGIEPDHYLCDRIARINEALIARRDKAVPKKKGGTP